jgi:hypothetical protein
MPSRYLLPLIVSETLFMIHVVREMLTLHYSSIFILIIVLPRAVITVRVKDDLLPSAYSTSTYPPLVCANPLQDHVSSITPKSLVADLSLFCTCYLTIATDTCEINI